VYKVNKCILIDEKGKRVEAYGIQSKKYIFRALACNKEKVELLCNLCNRLDLPEEQLIYVVEDFIQSNK